MKEILRNKILNIAGTEKFDNKFKFNYLIPDFKNSKDIEIFDMGELLKEKENTELLHSLGNKFAMYSNVYSEKDELEIFKNLFDYAVKNNKKIHINGITLKKEIEILEEYYDSLGYKREDVNCYIADFSKVLVTVGVNIENLIWRGSDYKKYKSEIFFIPPIREAGLTKAMFKGINKGVICNINIKKLDNNGLKFLWTCLKSESILALTLAKVLYFNLVDRGFIGQKESFETDIYES